MHSKEERGRRRPRKYDASIDLGREDELFDSGRTPVKTRAERDHVEVRRRARKSNYHTASHRCHIEIVSIGLDVFHDETDDDSKCSGTEFPLPDLSTTMNVRTKKQTFCCVSTNPIQARVQKMQDAGEQRGTSPNCRSSPRETYKQSKAPPAELIRETRCRNPRHRRTPKKTFYCRKNPPTLHNSLVLLQDPPPPPTQSSHHTVFVVPP